MISVLEYLHCLEELFRMYFNFLSILFWSFVVSWQGFLPDEMHVFGYARSNMTNEELHEKLLRYNVCS